MLGQRVRRLLAPNRGVLVGGRDRTAVAALDHAELRRADPHPPPPVLGPGHPSTHDQVRPEPHHRQRPLVGLLACGDQLVECGQGGLGGEEQRVPVAEVHRHAGTGVVRVGLAPVRVVGEDQPDVLAQDLAEPLVRLAAGQRGGERRPPEDRDVGALLARGVGHHQVLVLSGAHLESAVGAQPRVDQQHLAPLAGGHGLAVGVDDHPAPVAGQPPSLDHRGLQLLAAARLHGEPAHLGEGQLAHGPTLSGSRAVGRNDARNDGRRPACRDISGSE